MSFMPYKELNSVSPKVVIKKCSEYINDEVYKTVKDSVDLLGGMSAFVKNGERMLLKPNFLVGKPPEAAITTHPAVVGAIIRLVKEAGATPIVGDSPGLGRGRKAAREGGIP